MLIKKLKKRRVKLKNRKIDYFKGKTILIVGIWLFKIGSLLLMRENNLLVKQQKIQESKEEVEDIKRRELEELEKISKYTKEQARDAVMKMVEDKMSKEIATYIKEAEAEAKLNVDEKSKELLVGAMQKYAADITSEQTVSVINLPNDEMKGRLIGREGRNIRTIESVTELI